MFATRRHDSMGPGPLPRPPPDPVHVLVCPRDCSTRREHSTTRAGARVERRDVGGYFCRFATLLVSKHFSSRVVRWFRCSLRPAPERPWFDSEQLAILDSPFGTSTHSTPQREGRRRAPSALSLLFCFLFMS
jgi:hypothetical protein